MGNLIWTGILYFSTFGIVYVTYRVFVQDRKAEHEGKTQDLIKKAYKTKPAVAAIAAAANDAPATRRRNRA